MYKTVWRLAACLVLALLAALGIAEWIVRRRVNDALWAAPVTALPPATQALTWSMVADQRRVVVLGDSIAAGWELPPGAAWPEQLPEVAASGRPAFCYGGRVFAEQPEWRARVPGTYLGDTVEEGLATLERQLREVTGLG